MSHTFFPTCWWRYKEFIDFKFSIIIVPNEKIDLECYFQSMEWRSFKEIVIITGHTVDPITHVGFLSD
jgi:hypothetical protein